VSVFKTRLLLVVVMLAVGVMVFPPSVDNVPRKSEVELATKHYQKPDESAPLAQAGQLCQLSRMDNA
jgi:hypothetical protein